ncbi:MAG: SMC family ATPase [Chloroflexota bacterium]
MIPVKLTMRNFMCYRGSLPPLHFDGIHLACLSGDNGNGKSALIDAITWALWGEARAKSADDLISMHQPEMEVELEFDVGQQRYRIIRKRARPKRQGAAGQSALELHMAADDGFKPISGDSIDQTQHKLNANILHMDYPTFVNSAYLRQGHADEFTIKRPAERKEVLASVLGLSVYDELEAQARELAKQQEAERARLESAIREMAEDLAQKPAYESEPEQAQGNLAGVEAVISRKEAELKRLRLEKGTLEKQKAQMEQIEAALRDSEGNLRYWEEQIAQHRTRLGAYEEVISQRAAIEAGYARFIAAKKLSDELDHKSRQSVSLEGQILHLERRISQAGQGLTTEHALTQSQISEREEKSQRLPELKKQSSQLGSQLRNITEREEALLQRKQAVQELQSQISLLESNRSRLEREIKEIAEKLDLLSHQAGARCPLCETELAAEGLKLIQSKYAAEGQNKNESLKTTQVEIAARNAELSALKDETSQTESRLAQEKAAIQNQTGRLEKEIAESEDSARQLAEKRERLTVIEQRLAQRDFAAAEQEALRQLEGELAGLGYSHEQHEQARRQLDELGHFEQSKLRLDDADSHIGQERTGLTRAEEALQQLRLTISADTQKRQELSAGLAALPQLSDDLSLAEAESKVLAAQRDQAQQRLWGIKSSLQRCAEMEAKKSAAEKKAAQAAQEEGVYRELAQAFGKGGIPATIIDMALPEIEVETNKLLGRMTDNRMNVKFETQRPKKTGGIIETLDINIADELGTRPYETFSGGEAFRINFAIRIALSRLLARRAGAPLRTLIIDEGFGTQDSTGLEKVREAINSIQEEFDRIFVVTHIEELRDAFPVRIDVVKTAEGSTVSIS